ncbi:F0F1 ATP synthase subunit gamma [bacterium (Candidatus Blackallbacteria) CG17_big_fil_post_rev_8_21_14_2_50_48_46]|uniref:F0F1 ATP synthase subunit gamma n=1 Tax=bacterium (Candidatus Blackallbacteria) CG17_big_fil_post_rev_8_21_14_2_50_48_46 TaxID=2014261 RepID=A0A2M7G0L2_9BACT|nr:MAG: F0F1 ATP synthase subunit gamma [bacterium (Candidatus Blackallbacteria) CG18_big_fil_WC_8_21_14_2_50_49_26]PIW15166.1 MAG: F0F1 ATP synthase subunit gamma [bacterium (Candidatus Blackallbacteria) CG17_big_fil_post_rev_8_21_14_2_50_48_46]PIW50157.1 MAG: F0F1 ATP synthase subunit gamma [bacterium (Candidatus Blackallbacteria) CG13_big_fil_rev_8_21_14_2_50_49_14]
MSNTTVSLRHKIASAQELQSVVRTMKVLAASSIRQYEQAVEALADYVRNIELGLSVCFRNDKAFYQGKSTPSTRSDIRIGAVIFGSDQGLVGPFNEIIVDFALKTLGGHADQAEIWAVGERVQTRLQDSKQALMGCFAVPNSVKAITPLITQILIESESRQSQGEVSEFHLFYNRPLSGSIYEPVSQALLPLDQNWMHHLSQIHWPSKNLPTVLGHNRPTLQVLIREYLFVSLFRACAESLASENASRLAAMQRADKNIEELLEDLNGHFYRLRQRGIDEELFDLTSGFEALKQNEKTHSSFQKAGPHGT